MSHLHNHHYKNLKHRCWIETANEFQNHQWFNWFQLIDFNIVCVWCLFAHDWNKYIIFHRHSTCSSHEKNHEWNQKTHRIASDQKCIQYLKWFINDFNTRFIIKFENFSLSRKHQWLNECMKNFIQIARIKKQNDHFKTVSKVNKVQNHFCQIVSSIRWRKKDKTQFVFSRQKRIEKFNRSNFIRFDRLK